MTQGTTENDTGEKLQIGGIPSFGRYLSDYEGLFDFKIEQLRGKRVLDCASGGASFPAEAVKLGIEVVAVDPLFFKSTAAIERQTAQDIKHVVGAAMQMKHLLAPSPINTFEEGMAFRMAGNKIFLDDLDEGIKRGTYVGGSLPNLPFKDKEFDVSLLGHFLFCYGDRLSYDLHLQSIRDLVRVTKDQVRIYPLRGLDLKLSPYIEPLIVSLANVGISAEVRENNYQEVMSWKEFMICKPA